MPTGVDLGAVRLVGPHLELVLLVLAVAAVHRVGPIAIGDAALVAAVSSAHRAEAFAACGARLDAFRAEQTAGVAERPKDEA